MVNMIIPIRCFSCGKVIASVYEEFKRRVETGEKANEVLDVLKVDRYCCRRMILSHVDLLDEIKPYT
jgi:DNA-directed RNA polymerase subunit N